MGKPLLLLLTCPRGFHDCVSLSSKAMSATGSCKGKFTNKFFFPANSGTALTTTDPFRYH
jgi:hypothetical protein